MLRLFAALSLILLLPGLVLAHHGFTGRYDLSRPLWVRGQVINAYFGQPHPTLTIRTAPDMAVPATKPDPAGARAVIDVNHLAVRDDTRGRDVLIEFPPTSAFFNLDRGVAVGDTVSVIAFRNCDAPHQLRGQWLLADKAGASPVLRANRQTYQVDRCS